MPQRVTQYALTSVPAMMRVYLLQYIVFLERNIYPFVGGTGDGGKVSVNGKVYADADVYALIRNNEGKIKVYKENIYKQVPDCRFIASKTDRSKYLIGELNGKPAKKVYQDILNIGDKEMATQTLKIH